MSSSNSDSAIRPPLRSVLYRAAVALSVLLWVVRFLPQVFPDARLWGINHLLFLPPMFMIIYISVGAVALLMALPVAAEKFSRWFTSAAGLAFDRAAYVRWAAAALICIALFWFLRMPVNLLGDGYTAIHNIGDALPVIYKWTETGAIRLVRVVFQLLPVEGLEGARYAYALISVIAGGATVFFFFGIAVELAADPARRLLFFCLLLFSGWSLLFFGYAENYPVLWPVLCAYVYFGMRHIRGKSGVIIPGLLLVLAMVLHLQTVFFAASYLALVFGVGKGRQLYGRHETVIRAVVAVLVIGLGALFVWKYDQSISFRVHFLPLLFGRPATPDYAMLAPGHLLDMLNELLLLVPLLPVMLALGWTGLRSAPRRPGGVFFFIFACGGLLLLLVLDPRLGMARDWDLFALSGLGVTLLLLWSMARVEIDIKRLCPLLACMAGVLVFPYFATNLSAKPSIEYMKWALNLDEAKSTSGMIMLRDYCYNEGEVASADSLELIIRERRVIVKYADRAMELAKAGRFQEAMVQVDTVFRLDPYSRESFNLRAAVYFQMGRYEETIDDYEVSLGMEPYDFRVLVNLAQAYYKTKRHESMMKYLRRAQLLNPDAVLVLQGFAMGFVAQRQYDSALIYGERLIRTDSTVANGYLAAGLSRYAFGHLKTARYHLERYVELSEPGPDVQRAINLLKTIEQKLQER